MRDATAVEDVSGEALTVPRAIIDRLFAHARAELPNEACGLLAGDLEHGRVAEFHPARNAERSPYRFEVHPEDLVRIVLGIDASGVDLVAIFHSHVRTPAVPSAADVRSAAYPVVNLIASVAAADVTVRAWRIDAGHVREVALRLSA